MSVSTGDWNELLTHMRTRVREVGLGIIDDRLMGARPDVAEGKDAFLWYFSALHEVARAHSSAVYEKALQRFRAYVEVPPGVNGIQGIEIRVSERDRMHFDSDSVPLDSLADLSVLAEELEKLKESLRRSGVFDEQAFD